jgi:replicative DNA helicase
MGPDDNRHSVHPNAVEAERALLGGLIQRPDVLEEIRRDLDAADFWRDDHRLLFTLLVEMQLNGEAIDLITIPERVLRTGTPGKYGGIAYVIELPEHAPSTVNLEHYAGLIRSKSLLRQMMTLGNELTTHASRHPDDVNSLLDKTTSELVRLSSQGSAGKQWHPISIIVDDEIMKFEELASKGGGENVGLSSGFARLD